MTKTTVQDDEFLLPPGKQPRGKNTNQRDYAGAAKVSESSDEAIEPSSDRNKFLDDRGDPTYFYHNISNGKIHVTDLDITIDAGACLDLLDLVDEEKILKSRNLRGIIRQNGNRAPLLKRLTSAEFDVMYAKFIKRQQVINKQKEEKSKLLEKGDIQEIKKFSSKNSDEMDIRPQLQSLVEKLRVGNLDVNGKEAEQIVREKIGGITPEEFIMKIEVMQLTRDEVDYVFQTVMDKEVRKAVQEKYGEINE